jgi:hypothetical protein
MSAPMKTNRSISALAFGSLVISMALFAAGIRSIDGFSVYAVVFELAVSVAMLFVSFTLISRMRCVHCGKKLEIAPFPSYNPLPKFLLWTGAEARCGACNQKA